MVKQQVFAGKTWYYAPKISKTCPVIMMSLGIPKMIVAVLKMSDKDLDYQLESVNMRQAIVDNTRGYFSAPFSPGFTLLAQWESDNQEFMAAILAVKNKEDGAGGRYDAALLALRITLWFAQTYVSGIMLLNQHIAAEIAGNAKMYTEQAGTSNKQEIAVSQTNAAGEISVKTLGPKNDKGNKIAATFERLYSSDKGDTWTPMQSNMRANDIATGLDKDLIYVFKKRYTTAKGGTTGWKFSDPISPK